MTNEQYEKHLYADLWLKRTWDIDNELNQLRAKREKIISSMSGIGKYDDRSVIGGSDANPTETKNIEFSILSEKIEKLENELSRGNAETINVIYLIDDSKIRGMLIGRYINRLPWKKVGEMYNCAERRSYYYRARCLETIYPYIPKGEIL